ncbi:MAG: CDP-alcohol phosphatidyltransferase family protein [Flavobacteriales bacterium]|nr:CDP-alcohol phosphatidyltransferase family protein [Flavobacteriales bacterium]MBW7853113.1 CDP-alcohol phosphatidyltransferase family protein [Candidatus Kapabacteria bacterium]MCC6331398.1 CDP-alcohol phosphatidyltransferase family protein [Ignavibacteria bacterium]NOG67236.1 CDP-alcohol phosphatidyltransferase family protein [Chlorobiota bacterium]MBZ0194495.1 CDP-alcohol phosphatidyltransferase family protein [Candidatus Kapabacteria bacterium]
MFTISGSFFTIGNLLSLLRILMTVPAVYLLLQNQRLYALVVCVVAAISDYLDGAVSRATDTVSEWGRILDPVADKVFVAGVVVTLLYLSLLPLWFVSIVLLRDVLIIAGSFIMRRRTDTTAPSMLTGKIAVTAIAITGLVSIMDVGDYLITFMVVTTMLMALSLWDYSRRFYGTIR